MSVQPLRDFIVITKDEAPKKSASGLFLAPTEEKIVTGTVIATGSGQLTTTGDVVPLEVKVNDKVAFNRSFATEVKDGETAVLLLREEHILCVLK